MDGLPAGLVGTRDRALIMLGVAGGVAHQINPDFLRCLRLLTIS